MRIPLSLKKHAVVGVNITHNNSMSMVNRIESYKLDRQTDINIFQLCEKMLKI